MGSSSSQVVLSLFFLFPIAAQQIKYSKILKMGQLHAALQAQTALSAEVAEWQALQDPAAAAELVKKIQDRHAAEASRVFEAAGTAH